MNILVSACLLGENCKYNGGNNRKEKVLKLMGGNGSITVYPEQLGGLPTPRVPAEICNEFMVPGTINEAAPFKGRQLSLFSTGSRFSSSRCRPKRVKTLRFAE